MEESLNNAARLRQGMMPELSTINLTIAESVNAVGFIEKGTGQHQSNTVYSSKGISPCMNAANWKEPYKVVECKKVK